MNNEEKLIKVEYTVDGNTGVIYYTVEKYRELLRYAIQLEEPNAGKNLDAFERLLKEPIKRVWVDDVLGCIGFNGYGHRIYEDIIHDVGNGNFRYYIQENAVDYHIWITPSREDIPQKLWGKEVTSRWIQFRKDDKSKEG